MKFVPCKSLYLLLSLSLVFPSYAKTQKNARNELAQMKIKYTEKDFLFWTQAGRTDAVKLFLDAGMNPNVKDNGGQTALMSASWFGQTETVQALLAKGAEVNAKDSTGRTALMFAAQYGHTETVQALLAKGAAVNTKAAVGNTALKLAASNKYPDIIKLLKSAGAQE